jgi:hypothetical protein
MESAMAARIEEPLPVNEQQRVIGALRRFVRAGAYASMHHDELLRDYPEHWVAVSADGLVAAKPTRPELLRALRELGGNHDDLSIRFITSKRQVLVL